MTNELAHRYQLDASSVIFRGSRSDSIFFIPFFNKISLSSIAPDGTPHFAASHLGLYCLPMSHKKDASVISTKTLFQ